MQCSTVPVSIIVGFEEFWFFFIIAYLPFTTVSATESLENVNINIFIPLSYSSSMSYSNQLVINIINTCRSVQLSSDLSELKFILEVSLIQKQCSMLITFHDLLSKSFV